MGSSLPLIGIVCGHQQANPERYYVNAPYVHAVNQVNGIPILIPPMPKERLFSVLEIIDGLLVPGGIDIDPHRFGEDPHPKLGEIDPHWDELDLTVIGWALQKDIPILAICRGVQVLNVACGGTLVQDIPSQITDPIKHTQEAPKWYATHDITVQPSTMLNGIFRDRPQRVNSFHHQAIRQVGKGLRVAATAPDGVIEAVEGIKNRFVLGVQWHPELMTEHYPAARQLFSEFVRACTVDENAKHGNLKDS